MIKSEDQEAILENAQIVETPLPAENKIGTKIVLPDAFNFTPGDDGSDRSSYMGSEKFEMFDFGRDRLTSNPMEKSGNTPYNFQKSR